MLFVLSFSVLFAFLYVFCELSCQIHVQNDDLFLIPACFIVNMLLLFLLLLNFRRKGLNFCLFLFRLITFFTNDFYRSAVNFIFLEYLAKWRLCLLIFKEKAFDEIKFLLLSLSLFFRMFDVFSLLLHICSLL